MSVLSSRAEMGKEKAWQAVEARLQLLQRAAALAGRAEMQLVKPWRDSLMVSTQEEERQVQTSPRAQ